MLMMKRDIVSLKLGVANVNMHVLLAVTNRLHRPLCVVNDELGGALYVHNIPGSSIATPIEIPIIPKQDHHVQSSQHEAFMYLFGLQVQFLESTNQNRRILICYKIRRARVRFLRFSAHL